MFGPKHVKLKFVEGGWGEIAAKVIEKYELKPAKTSYPVLGSEPGKKSSKEDADDPRLLRLKAFLTPSVYVMLADGERQEEEEIQLMAMLVTSPVLRGLKPSQLGEVIDAVINDLQKRKDNLSDELTIRGLLKAMPDGVRDSSYAYAVRISYADQLQTEEEKRALEALQSWMGVSPDLASKIDGTMRLLVAAPKIV